VSASVWPPEMRLHKATGQARIRWKGKEKLLGPFGSAEAHINYARWLEENDPGSPPAAPRVAGSTVPPAPAAAPWPTVAGAVLRWEAEEAPRYDPAGREPDQFRCAFRPLLGAAGGLRTDEFDLDALERVREAMRARGWCARVCNRAVTRVRTVWRWLERKRLAPPGSWAALRALEPVRANDRRYRHTRPLEPLGEGEYELLLVCCHPTLRAMVELQWLTGVRSGELVRMTAGEVDRDGDEGWVFRPTRHKTAWRGHTRAVPLGPRAAGLLAPWLDGKGASEWVFPSHRGNRPGRKGGPLLRGPRRYTVDGYAQAFERAGEYAGLMKLRPYLLRHACKKRVAAAINSDAARCVLGHSTSTTT
jgi:integrase